MGGACRTNGGEEERVWVIGEKARGKETAMLRYVKTNSTNSNCYRADHVPFLKNQMNVLPSRTFVSVFRKFSSSYFVKFAIRKDFY
jgi:hypothetical protein